MRILLLLTLLVASITIMKLEAVKLVLRWLRYLHRRSNLHMATGVVAEVVEEVVAMEVVIGAGTTEIQGLVLIDMIVGETGHGHTKNCYLACQMFLNWKMLS